MIVNYLYNYYGGDEQLFPLLKGLIRSIKKGGVGGVRGKKCMRRTNDDNLHSSFPTFQNPYAEFFVSCP